MKHAALDSLRNQVKGLINSFLVFFAIMKSEKNKKKKNNYSNFGKEKGLQDVAMARKTQGRKKIPTQGDKE